MLYATISGSRLAIFSGLHDDAIRYAADHNLTIPSFSVGEYFNFAKALSDRRISHTITLSREN